MSAPPTLRAARFGLIALWRIPDEPEQLARALDALHPEERALAGALAPVRQREWIAGRVALRAALEHQALDDGAAILRDDRGAPRTPERAVASLSHKGQWAAALAAPRRHGCSLGIDLEQKAGPRVDIAARVCTQRELASLAPLGQAERGHAITLRFSAKEAVYKAIDPWLRRYVGFREVEVDLWPDGTGRAVAVAPALIGELGAAGVELTWESVGEHWLCTARATR